MGGFLLGQPYGYGRTQQVTVEPGSGVPGFDAPAAGASYTATLQRADWFRLIGLSFLLTTDANVASRYVTVQYLDGKGVPVLADSAPVLVTANTTNQRFCGSLHHGPAEWNTGTDVQFNLSGLWLEAGRAVKLNIASVQAADALTQVRFTFDRTPVEQLER